VNPKEAMGQWKVKAGRWRGGAHEVQPVMKHSKIKGCKVRGARAMAEYNRVRAATMKQSNRGQQWDWWW